MPKVGCFWPGLFKSSNCLFPWAARETGKCSSFRHGNSHFYVREKELEEITASPLAMAASTAAIMGCAAWLCRLQGWVLIRGFPTRISS